MGLELNELLDMAKRCRRNIVEMTSAANAGHPGGSLSAIDILCALYGTRLRVDVGDPQWTDRDRFIMSKGHASPGMYSILHERGFLSSEDLMTFRELGSPCQGHVDMKWCPGVDFSAGSLGMGLSFGIGVALAATMQDSERTAWVMLGDGELQEGQIWEGVMAATHLEVGNLKVFVDRNGIQNDDFVNEQMRIFDVAEKFAAFGWNVKEIDGHDMQQICDAIAWADSIDEGPCCVIAHTVKGKGVSFMENNPAFHGMAANPEQLIVAREELS
uniref:Transketolase (TktA, tktB) n=1 Tax=uncultured marine group II/III euryarchaeote KM3_28_D12 TaxID=1456431 RepID=A0A075GWZ7_9EURY|nr:Transketolase (tktA, tktB) [uncultured marine group II/III euryarchaeote KM3_28_D12]